MGHLELTDRNLTLAAVCLKTSHAFESPAEWLFSLSGKKYDMETTCLFFVINVMVRHDPRAPGIPS